MNNIFRTTIQDLISRNKFFQCFVCYEQFDAGTKYPMEVCRNHHYMCGQCVKSRAFKSRAKNQYKCGLCSVQIKITEIKKNPFILSIKQFFENLTEREEQARSRYKEYMENQQNIVSILLEENGKVVNEMENSQKEAERLKEKIKKMQKKHEQQLKKVKASQKQKSKPIEKPFEKFVEKEKKRPQIEISSNEEAEFQKWTSGSKDDKNMPKNSIFRSSLFASSMKANQVQEKNESQFVPHPGFSQIYYQNKPIELEPFSMRMKQFQANQKSKVAKLIDQGKKIKQNLINEERQSKIKLKESIKQLQTHNKYIDLSHQHQKQADDDVNDELGLDNYQKQGQPQKKVHIEQPKHNLNPVKKHNSWFPFA